jgi:integrase
MARTLEGRLEPRPLRSVEGQERWAWVGRVAGRKQTLGRYPEMSEDKAQKELAYMVGQVARGDWKPATPAPALPPRPEAKPDMYKVITEFLANLKTRGLGASQVRDISGLLTTYVLRHLREFDEYGRERYPFPDELGVAAVERLRDKLKAERQALDDLRAAGVTHMDDRARPLKAGDRSGAPLPKGLGPRRINRAIRSLWRAIDYAAPRYGTPTASALREADDLLLVVKTAEGPHLTTGQIHLLLEAARQEEEQASARSRHLARVAPVAVLALAGLRLGELCNLRVMDVETTRRRWRIHVIESKTSAGKREIPISGYLQRVLAAHLMRRRAEGAGPRSPLFATRNETAISQDNFRNREWARTVERANNLCLERGERPIPGIGLEAPEDETRATPHALRRSFITHMARLGTHPKRLMRLVGHKDAKVTIEIYERVEDDDDDLEPLVDRDPLLKRLYGDEEPADNVVSLPVRQPAGA